MTPLFSINFHDFDAYQYQLTHEEVVEKIERYLQKSLQISSHYYFTKDALHLEGEEAEYILHFAPFPISKPSRPQKRLSQTRIALDPGHFGGAFSHLEKRYVKLIHEDLEIDEGTLTYLTALELKTLLEAEGAQVFMTRSKIGQGAMEGDFFSWIKEQPHLTGKPSKIFRDYYNQLDLRARASAINAFNPDVTVILHYNAHPCSKFSPLTQANYNMAFIPGAFCCYELKTAEDRYEFLRLIVTDILDESLKLSQNIVSQFSKHLNVPLISDEEPVSYTHRVCLKQEEGIYARNLALTRLVHSPLCYGETLVQNNEAEFYRLSRKDSAIQGIPCSSRIKEVARAYFEGLRTYFESSSPSRAITEATYATSSGRSTEP